MENYILPNDDISSNLGLIDVKEIQSILGYTSKKTTTKWLMDKNIKVFNLGKLNYVKLNEFQDLINGMTEGKRNITPPIKYSGVSRTLSPSAKKFLLDT